MTGKPASEEKESKRRKRAISFLSRALLYVVLWFRKGQTRGMSSDIYGKMQAQHALPISSLPAIPNNQDFHRSIAFCTIFLATKIV